MTRWRSGGFRGIPLGWRLLSGDRMRFFVTVTGVGLVTALMLFLAGVYGGVETEANGYVAGRPVDAWVALNNSTNLIRSSSFLSSEWLGGLKNGDEVASVAPLLRLITTLSVRGKAYTAFVCGIDPSEAATRPAVVRGPGTLGRGDILLDLALARRTGASVGDLLLVQGHAYRVSGLTTGTNVVISQFTFVNLTDAQELLPVSFRRVVSFFLVTAKPGVSRRALVDRLRRNVEGGEPALVVFTADEFERNNLDEMRSGLLPMLATVVVFGGLVGTAVLTLLLYGSIIERREDYALLKAIGASRGFLCRLVLKQALVTVAWGFLVGLGAYVAAQPVVTFLVPVVAVSLSLPACAVIAGISLTMAAFGVWIPLSRLEGIYPAEVFRA